MSSADADAVGPSPGEDRRASSSSVDVPNPNLRGLFAGSGVEGLSHPLLNAQILNLLPPEKTKEESDSMGNVKVLYLGTATYDLPLFRTKQTGRFVDKGCDVSWLDVALDDPQTPIDLEACATAIETADVILVGGGNTLYAVDRWERVGLVPLLRKAAERGAVLAGGSAGAICWFDSGHSDSADPESYREAMLKEFGDPKRGGDEEKPKKEDESSDYDPMNQKGWEYLRCPGLGFVPGPFVCCPHHDKVQSNGLLRAHDFDRMLLARATSSGRSVLGLGIDHYSAFIVEGEDYKIYAIPEKPGSVSERDDDDGEGGEGSFFFDVAEDGTPRGRPGVWIKRVLVAKKDGGDHGGEGGGGGPTVVVEARVCPPSGKLADLLAYGGDNLPPQKNVEEDENWRAVERCRAENPSSSPGGR